MKIILIRIALVMSIFSLFLTNCVIAAEKGKLFSPFPYVMCEIKEDARYGALSIYSEYTKHLLHDGDSFIASFGDSPEKKIKKILNRIKKNIQPHIKNYCITVFAYDSNILVHKKHRDSNYDPYRSNKGKNVLTLWHYTQLSIVSLNGKSVNDISDNASQAKIVKNKKMWVAIPTIKDNPNALKTVILESGEGW